MQLRGRRLPRRLVGEVGIRPILRRAHLRVLALQPLAHDVVPRGDMLHDLGNRVHGWNRALCRQRDVDLLEKISPRRTLPGVAAQRAPHLVCKPLALVTGHRKPPRSESYYSSRTRDVIAVICSTRKLAGTRTSWRSSRRAWCTS